MKEFLGYAITLYTEDPRAPISVSTTIVDPEEAEDVLKATEVAVAGLQEDWPDYEWKLSDAIKLYGDEDSPGGQS